MPTFLYIDYGPSPYIGRELRYSLSTLLAEYPVGDARVVVYTDKPRTTTISMSAFAPWTFQETSA